MLVTGCGAAQHSSQDDRAGLAFTRYDENENPSVWVADADGSNAKRLATNAWGGKLSPGSRRVAYSGADSPNSDEPATLYVQDLDGGKPQGIAKAGWSLSWAPDGEQLALGEKETLSLLDVRSGNRRELAQVGVQGDIFPWQSLGFAPNGKALTYARRDTREAHLGESDIFVVDLATGKSTQLTRDGRSDSPVWGRDWIAFRHFRFVNDDQWPSIGELWLMRPDGSDAHLFARGDEDMSMAHWGVEPVDFSADGKRLLACYSREFGCPPVTFTVPEGKRHELKIRDLYINAADLASDGTEVLVNSGLIEGPYDVYSIPFEGGPARLLAKNAAFANWADVDEASKD
jgi:Tol biopolymer transport system component